METLFLILQHLVHRYKPFVLHCLVLCNIFFVHFVSLVYFIYKLLTFYTMDFLMLLQFWRTRNLILKFQLKRTVNIVRMTYNRGYKIVAGTVVFLCISYVIVCPYTKVEESFNLQAIHDLIYHQQDLEKVRNFSVSMSFIMPFVSMIIWSFPESFLEALSAPGQWL